MQNNQLTQTLITQQKQYSSSTQQSNHAQNQDSLGFLQQTLLLSYKNLILTIKNPKNLIFLIITPFLLSAFMFWFQTMARNQGSRVRTQTRELSFSNFAHCFGQNCISLDYRVISSEKNKSIPTWVDYTIKYIMKQSGLSQKDIHKGQNIVTYKQDLRDYYDYFLKNKNKTQIGLIFCDKNITQFNMSLLYCDNQHNYTYYLMLNKTDSLSVIFHDFLEPLPIDNLASSLKMLVDNAILNLVKQNTLPNSKNILNYTRSQFPVGQNKFIQDYDIVTSIGAFYYLITPLFAFLFIQNQIVRQKQYKLRQGLNIFGAGHGSYWTSWIIVSIVYSLLASVSSYLAGLAFGFGFFTQTPAYITILFLMFPFCFSMQMFAYFLSSVSPSLKTSNTISYAIMLFAIVVQSFVSNDTLLTFLFTEDVSPTVAFLKYFFNFYPPFSYTKIFTNITQYSGYHFSFVQRRWVQNPNKYNIDIFTSNTEGPLPFGGGNFYRYSDFYSMLILYGNALFFLMLTWYFDHTLSSNRGTSQPFYYPFNKIYRYFIKKQKRNLTFDLANLQNQSISFEQSSVKQRNKVYFNSKNNIPAKGLRIKNLSKTFTTFFSKSKVQAIKNLTLQIQQNQLMGILGHNGAGKTTLINILTGVLPPNLHEQTQIIIQNHPIQDIKQIRKHIGVCSQFDILWNQLTPQQHLYMFARLKAIPKQQINQKIDNVLTFVNLIKQKNNLVGSFSGGMKRRLSLAIATIADPKIILLDQPTTGLDPKIRQQVWELIQKLKKGKSIILTTHSMQQADVLADRIAVVAKGRLKCIGTTFYLKKTYGQGHRLTINIKSEEDEQIVVNKISKLYPSIKKVDCRGGSLIMSTPNYEQLLGIVKRLQSSQSLGLDEYEIKKGIKAWSVSHSTLQQVFMKVSKQKSD